MFTEYDCFLGTKYLEDDSYFSASRVIPNCQFRSKTARLKTFTANQIDEIKDPSGLFYILPFQKVMHLCFISDFINL